MEMADKYILRITAGPSYDEKTHVEVPVNQPEPMRIESDAAEIELNIRIKNYTGLPRGSPSTSSYFSAQSHAYNQDQYSISFRFTPLEPSGAQKDGSRGISGSDLQFGNDFDRPIRDRLPPGFNTALSIVKWWIDPGLEGDAYADKPYLYGPALSSFNIISVGSGTYDESKGGLLFQEGGDKRGMAMRNSIRAPQDSKARMKWALSTASKQKWVWEYGRTYGIDFFNPYLDFANLALKLPGFQLSVAKYIDGHGVRSDRRLHQLRYVLRNKATNEVYLVVVFSLHLKEDVDEDGTLKEGGIPAVGEVDEVEVENGEYDDIEALKEAREELGSAHEESETSTDDVD